MARGSGVEAKMEGKVEDQGAKSQQVLPEDMERLLHQARLLRNRNRNEEAINVYNKVVACDARNFGALMGLGHCLKKLGNAQKALACYQAAAQVDPENWRAHNDCGVVLKEMGRMKDALKEYSLAVSLHPDARNVAKDNLAVLVTDLGTQAKVAGNLQEGKAKYAMKLFCFWGMLCA